jgi:Trypsin-like serine proteases, typically periplasmic, contain C-terminal PDZ domain
MKYLVRSFAIAVFATFALTSATLAQDSKSGVDKARGQSNAVVVLTSLDDAGRSLGQGSGFVVTPAGAVVTSLHVVRGSNKVRVKFPSGDVYVTDEIVDFDVDKDIAVLKIKGFQLPVVKLGDSDRTDVGEQVVAISSPEGLTNSLTTGVISGVRRLSTHRVFQITAPISQGSSGGALFDSSGNVVAITSYILRSGQNINFAVPINYVRGMISDQVRTTIASLPTASQSVRTDPQPSQGTLDTEINSASRRLGRTENEPMFVRPDEGLAFFYRGVEGIGQATLKNIQDVARTAVLEKTAEDERTEQYTIRYVTDYAGMAFNLKKPDMLLESVDLLVSWSVDTATRHFGDKYKKKTIDGQPVLEFKKGDDKRLVRAYLDGSERIRFVRFTKVK